MNAGITFERVYEEVKRRIRERGFRPGERLDPAQLGEALASSVTPVRGALHRLEGERLVESRKSEGFHLPQVDVAGLRDLYRWNGQVLRLAVAGWADEHPGLVASEPATGTANDLAAATADRFLAIARVSPNIEHEHAVRSANDRLHAARLAEAGVLDELEAEWLRLEQALRAGERGEIRALITRYHRRRDRAADSIVRALYRGDREP